MKKILVFTTYFYPHLGGYEKNVEELFSRIAKKGDYEVDIVCLNTEKKEIFEKRNSLNIYRIDCWNMFGGTYALPKLKSWKKIRNNLYAKKYCVVSTQTRFFFSSFLGYLFARKNKLSLIHTERGTTFVKHKNPLVFLASFFVDQTLGRIIFSKADTVVGVSQKACNFAKSLGARNPVKIFNGINTELWKRKKVIKKDSGFLNITFVGRIIEAKGVQDLLLAIRSLNNKDKLLINIVGEGNYLEKLKKISKKLEFNNIYFFGKKNSEDIIEILSKTDIFVNPSYTEGLPTSVMEAGACECAVVASNIGGTEEIIDDGINGYIFKPKDINRLSFLIKDLLENPLKRNEFGEKLCKKIKEKFDWENIVNQYLELIEK